EIIERVKEVFVRLIGTIRSSEEVNVIVPNSSSLAEAEKMVGELYGTKGVNFFRIPAVDVWIRDYGPTFLTGRGTLAGVKWVFNAWGGKYKELERDDATGFRVLESTAAIGFIANLVIEGGMIEVGERGEVLITRQAALDKRRNPGFSRSRIETALRNYLGVTRVVWLDRGISGDDTDGHVDTFVRLAPGGAVLVAEERRRESPNYAVLREAQAVLEERLREPDQDEYTFYKVPMPSPVRVLGTEVPATYLNFLVTNRHVIVPTFGQPEDEEALEVIAEAFRGREVVPIRSEELFFGLGGIHCVTLEVPAV
ncbi:MAG: agmatine deiminase family protein, partial [Nitrososphaerota archaeon]